VHYLSGIRPKIDDGDVEIMDDAKSMFYCNNEYGAIGKFYKFKDKLGKKYQNIIKNTN
jgi:hypothetical protein